MRLPGPQLERIVIAGSGWDAAILLDPMDVEGFTREMVRVLADSDLRRGLRERGLARAAQFSWDRTARETIAVYRALLQ